MGKTNLKILLCILFTFGCSKKIAARYRNEFNDENITDQDEDTKNFDDQDSQVSNHSCN